VDEDLLGGLGLLVVVGSFDEFAALKRGAGADERDEMACVDRAPACLGGFDELERHRQPRGTRARTAGDLGPVPDGGERRFDGVGRAEVNPVLGGVVVEREQLLEVVGDLRRSLGELRPVGALERSNGVESVPLVLGVPDLRERLLGPGMGRLR
jgi:hypothetical protein